MSRAKRRIVLSMKDTELYRHILGIMPPWTVEKVNLDAKALRIDIQLEHRMGCGGTAQSATSPVGCMITQTRESGVIWIVVSS